jgi:hypothetical protein
LEISVGIIYNALQNSQLHNRSFTREIGDRINELRDLHLVAEFVLLGDMNRCVGAMQVNLPRIWGVFENVDSIIIIILEVGQIKIKYAILKERKKMVRR